MSAINPGSVHVDHTGFITTRWFVRLPHAMTADDLKEPKLWVDVQRQRSKRLRKHDTIFAVGFDESFAVSAVVVDATPESAVLGGMKIIKFPERLTPLFSDGIYRVAWVGEGFAVERIADGARMGDIHGSEQLAINHIRTLYPRPVGAA